MTKKNGFIWALVCAFLLFTRADASQFYFAKTDVLVSLQHIILGEVVRVVQESKIETSGEYPPGVFPGDWLVTLQIQEQFKGALPDTMITLRFSNEEWRAMQQLKIADFIQPERTVITYTQKNHCGWYNTYVNGFQQVMDNEIFFYKLSDDKMRIIPEFTMPLQSFKDFIVRRLDRNPDQ